MKHRTIITIAGIGCLLPLMGCVVAPPPPGPPVAVVAPAPMVVPPVAVGPVVAVGPGYWRWYHGHRVWMRRRWHHGRWR